MSVQDATHFTLRIEIVVGQISGHANLAMELRDAVQADRVEYRGQGIVAGSQTHFRHAVSVRSAEPETEVTWQGDVSLDGMLAMMAGDTA